MDPIINYITKGYLSSDVLSKVTTLIDVLDITQGVVTGVSIKGGGNPPLRVNREQRKQPIYYVKITYEYNNEIFTDMKYINRNINIKKSDLKIEIIDNKPIIKLIDESIDITDDIKIKIII